MLVIKPIESKDEQKEICECCGIEYIPTHFAYKAHNDGVLLGCAQFDIISDKAVIDALRQVVNAPDDFEGMFILSRAVLNFLDLCSVTQAEYSPSDEKELRLARALGFKGEGTMSVSLEGMFDAKCDGHCNE